MISLKPIRSHEDYIESQKQLESIFHSELDSEEGQKAEILSILIESYEKKMNPSPEDSNLEPPIDYIYDLVKSTAEIVKSEKYGIVERGLKLSEETGELAAEILKFVGFKNIDSSTSEIEQHMLLELTDCLIMIFDIMTYMGFTKQQIIDMSEKQVNKWLSKHIK